VCWSRAIVSVLLHGKAGAKQVATPGECIKACDITFACLTTPDVCMDVVFGTDGVLSGTGAGKSYVDCSTVDEACSQKIGVRHVPLMRACRGAGLYTARTGAQACVRARIYAHACTHVHCPDRGGVNPCSGPQEAIVAAGGRFLEAPVSGSKKPAEDGQLIFLTAGDQGLYTE